MWVFDVDGTLIGSIRSDVLRPGAVDLLDALAARDVLCALWSAGGGEYARRIMARHGLADRFVAFASKEERDAAGRYLAPDVGAVHGALRRVYVDDVPGDVPPDGDCVPVRQFLGGNPVDGELLELVGRLDQLIDRGSGSGAEG